MTLIIAFELRKENIEIHEVTRSEEGYVFWVNIDLFDTSYIVHWQWIQRILGFN